MQILIAWLASFLLASTPQLHTPDRVAYAERAAAHFVHVAFDPAEAPLTAGSTSRARTALQLAAIAALESQLREDVQRGHCRASECDHGAARCWMQVQPGTGLVLLKGGGYDYLWKRRAFVDGDLVVHPEDLLDEETCVRAALHLVRTSFKNTGSLREYTGERGAEAPLAIHRFQLAQKWLAKHPVPVKDAEAMR